MEYPIITSRQNRLVREAAALSDPAERRCRNAFLAEGARLCEDAARCGVPVRSCFFTEEARRKYASYLAPVLSRCGKAFQVEPHVAQLLSDTKHPQGVFCVCEIPENVRFSADSATPSGNCVVLENIQDPGNLGTMLRTAEALGIAEAWLLGGCCDVLSSKVLRASMGAVFREGIYLEPDAGQAVRKLRAAGYELYAAVPDADAEPVTEAEFQAQPSAVCIGNEGNGLTRQLIALCGNRITIPMGGRAESLNAATAASILMWEMVRGGTGCR